MGIGNLPDNTTVAAGLIVLSADFLKVISALNGSLIGRNTSGVASSGQSLGTALTPWGNIFGTNLIIGGSAIDVSGLTAAQNRIISGKVRSTSGQPAFLDPNGAAASVDILGATTTLSVSINGTVIEITTDITESGLTVAPGSNNTCLINDTSFLDQAISKYFGEIDSQKQTITIDTVGSEISSRVGQIIALKTGTSEIMLGFLKSATEFTDVKRGFLFDSSNAPIVRETIANNDTLTLLETGWVFITNDSLTVDVTYLTPVYSFTAPAGVETQYWFDMTNQVWKRHSGVEFVVINRTLLGVCIQDTSNCIGARSFDFDNAFDELNTIDAEVFSDTVVRSSTPDNSVNVYGTPLQIPYTYIEFNNSSDMETGSVAGDTEYYLYLTTDGESQISVERPYDRLGDLRGRYHPYNNWRYIADAKTDVDADWLSVLSSSTLDAVDKSADFETSKDLVIDKVNSTTSKMTVSKLKLLNSDDAPAFLTDLDETWDIALHLMPGTSAKDSTTYQMWIDSKRKLLLVPDLEGTADANVLNSLSDSTATLQTDLVQRWDEIYQTTDLTKGYVKAVSTENVLTIMDKDGADLDLFPLGTESYKIRMLSPVGLGSFKARPGNVFRNSGSAFDDSHYTRIQEEKFYLGDGTDFSVTSNGSNWVTGSASLSVLQANDWTGLGGWKTNFNISGSLDTTTNHAITISGIVFDSADSQTVIGLITSSSNWTRAITIATTGGINATGGVTSTGWRYSSGSYLLLNKKPSLHN